MNFKISIFISLFIFVAIISACQEKDSADIGNEYYKKGEYQKAIEAYNEHLKLKPSDEIVIYNRGRAYEELGMYDQALQNFKKVLKIDPTNESALLSYGKHLYREKDYKNAAYQFEKAYKLNTSSSNAALLLARALHKSGEVDKAMEYYNAAINNDKDNGEAYLYRGALKLHQNRQTSGCSDIRQAINMKVTKAEAFYNEHCK